MSIEISDASKPEKFIWKVHCLNGEDFIVDEPQVQRLRVKYDSAATAADKMTFGGPQTVAEPVSVMWNNSNHIAAITNCEAVLQDAATNRSSFSDEGRWQIEQDDLAALATITRGFSAQNAYGGTIPPRAPQ